MVAGYEIDLLIAVAMPEHCRELDHDFLCITVAAA